MKQGGWRKWHRWIAFAAAPFLLFAAITGVIAGIAEMVSDDEEAREKAREQESPAKLPLTNEIWSEAIGRALVGAAEKAKGAPVDRVTLDYKTDPPSVTVYLGKPGGGEDRKLIFNASTGAFLREEAYIDKPFLVRLHSGEALGDWGQALGVGWGLALIAITITGAVIYFAMRRPGRTGFGRVFW